MVMSLYDLRGTVKYRAGASGTVTLDPGEHLLSVTAHATSAGTLVIFGGDSIPLPASAQYFQMRFKHLNLSAKTGKTDLVFTSTDSYVVESVVPYGGTP